MPQKLYCLIVTCITILTFTLMMRNSLCEVHIKKGDLEVAAMLAYEVNR